MSEFNKFADLMIEAAYQENIKNLGKPMAELMKQSVIQLKPVIEIFFNKGMEIGKAQAVPEPSINMTGHDLKYIWDFMDYADPENFDTEVTIQLCKEGFDGAGLYAWVAEYPEEGGIKLGEAQEPAND